MDTVTDVPEITFATPMRSTTTEGANLPAPSAPPAVDTTIFQVIARAASDPAVNIDKMERLIAMQERMEAKRAQVEFDNAMSDAQAQMQPVRADANNPQTRSKYASYGALDGAIRPIYSAHGFSLSFNSDDAKREDDLRVLCRVAHRNGHREEYRMDMPADGKGAKGGDVMTRTHAAGSAVQYGKRYLLGMVFNIAVVRDDDGNMAGARGTAGAGTQFRSERREPGNAQAESLKVDNADLGMVQGDGRSQYEVTKEKKALLLVQESAKLAIGMCQDRPALKDWIKTNRAELAEKLPQEDYDKIIEAVDARWDELPAPEKVA